MNWKDGNTLNANMRLWEGDEGDEGSGYVAVGVDEDGLIGPCCYCSRNASSALTGSVLVQGSKSAEVQKKQKFSPQYDSQ